MRVRVPRRYDEEVGYVGESPEIEYDRRPSIPLERRLERGTKLGRRRTPLRERSPNVFEGGWSQSYSSATTQTFSAGFTSA